jgi:hypothetical protein
MNKKLIILLLICSALCSSTYNHISITQALEVTPETVVELEDVVRLNFTAWAVNHLEINETANGTVWVHDPNDPRAPNELYEQFPDLHVPPCQGFVDEILGMRAGDNRTFTVYWDDGNAINNVSDRFYHHDILYRVRLYEILLDATDPPFTPFDIPIFLPFMLFLVFLVIIIVYFRIRRFSKSYGLFSQKTKCFSCNSKATVKCGNPSCNTPYCKECFLRNNRCESCNSNRMIPLS